MSATTSNSSSSFKRIVPGMFVGALLVFLILCFYWIRPIFFIRWPLMLVYRHPALFTLPFLTGIGGGLFIGLLMLLFGRGKERLGNALGGAVVGWLVCGVLGLIAAMFWTSFWTEDAIYAHSKYGVLNPSELTGMQTRVKPFNVAEGQLGATLNSSTDHPDNIGLIKVHGKLTWTAVRDPDGLIRSFEHGASGLISVAGESSEAGSVVGTKETSGSFAYSPGSQFGKNFSWHAHESCYTCDITEVLAIPTPTGPMLAAPFVRWKGGWFVKHPVFSGVFIERSGGPFQTLSVAEAEANPTLVEAGHIFPAGLALRIAEAYAYKRGIANNFFTHKEQYAVGTVEGENQQPYLEDFKNLGMQWVTILEPQGQTYSTGAVITTSAINGQTRIWKTGLSAALIGPEKAVEVLKGQAGLGVNLNESGYEAIEPRQVFPPGHGLEFLISIVPTSQEPVRITENAVVDAHTQQVVAVFQANSAGDADLVSYLDSGNLPASEQFNGAGAGRQTGETSTPTQTATPAQTKSEEAKAATPSATSAISTFERLLAENQVAHVTSANRTALKAERVELEKLLATAKTRAGK